MLLVQCRVPWPASFAGTAVNVLLGVWHACMHACGVPCSGACGLSCAEEQRPQRSTATLTPQT